jgi:hypothetical protein
MKLALALLTKDHPELTKRSIEPLLQPNKFDLFWIDGSGVGSEGLAFARESNLTECEVHADIQGGPDAAIVYALTVMLDHYGERGQYSHIGIIEQDVLLHSDWLGPTLALFERGTDEGLHVGAVSARSYEDRILIQRDGYGVMHNLGSGMIILTREAARILLDNYRTAWSTDNRLIFAQLSGIDIGKFWAFRGSEQPLTADWNFDAILARHGLASLALTPSLATMLDQDIAAQGLKMADGNYDLLRDEKVFDTFANRTAKIRGDGWMPGIAGRLQYASGAYTIFPHQIPGIGGMYSGDWRLKWAQGFGPFVWEAGEDIGDEWRHPVTLEVPVLGPCEILLGGEGRARVADLYSGYTIDSTPADAGQGAILQVSVPSGVSYRTIRVEALAPGVGFYGLRTREPQPWLPGYRFDHSCLPPCPA